jgi:hypothetical protein
LKADRLLEIITNNHGYLLQWLYVRRIHLKNWDFII